MGWMPPPDGIEVCHAGDGCITNQRRRHPWRRLRSLESTWQSAEVPANIARFRVRSEPERLFEQKVMAEDWSVPSPKNAR